MYSYDLINLHVAHQVTHDQNEVRSDDPARVDVAHGISGGERLFGSDDGYDLETVHGFVPF